MKQFFDVLLPNILVEEKFSRETCGSLSFPDFEIVVNKFKLEQKPALGSRKDPKD
jgi:hypothetical protein